MFFTRDDENKETLPPDPSDVTGAASNSVVNLLQAAIIHVLFAPASALLTNSAPAVRVGTFALAHVRNPWLACTYMYFATRHARHTIRDFPHALRVYLESSRFFRFLS